MESWHTASQPDLLSISRGAKILYFLSFILAQSVYSQHTWTYARLTSENKLAQVKPGPNTLSFVDKNENVTLAIMKIHKVKLK